MPPEQLEAFIDDVFHNVLDLRECNRQREQGPVIQEIGDVFLAAASEFRLAYPAYVGHLPLSEKRLKEETDANANLRMFFEVRGPAHTCVPHDGFSNATCFLFLYFL
jgi:RHO1 GDP-GTP exchange protein 1/2